MKVALIGPELEENLSLRYLLSALERAGHDGRIFDFHRASQMDDIVRGILSYAPDCVGLSMVFTLRARQFVQLAESLRAAGYTGHITAGGHFATFHAADLLRDFPAFNSMVRGEGEETLVDLLSHLDDPSPVAGISFRGQDGAIVTTDARPNPKDLDSRAHPKHSGVCNEYLGKRIVNMIGGRGCYGNCAFCSINAWYRQNPGERFRQRRESAIAGEMAVLYHERGARIFNFHDDNFFLPQKEHNLARFRELQRQLRARGMKKIAIQVKARPDSVDEEVMTLLKEIGLFRVFLGVENGAVAGLKALNRGIRCEQNHEALRVLRGLNVHVSFNLLMFEPDATLSDLRDNAAFIRRYADRPLNFGRVEVYSGTLLEKRLREQGRLLGDYFGYNYRIADERAQRAFELFRPVFFPRNFAADGLNLAAMRLDYIYHLLRHFFPARARPALERRVRGMLSELNGSNADLLEAIFDFAEHGQRSAASSETFAADLARKRQEFDAGWRLRSEAVTAEIESAAAGRRRSQLMWRASAAAAAVVITVTGVGCKEHPMVDPLPPPATQTTPVPPTAAPSTTATTTTATAAPTTTTTTTQPRKARELTAEESKAVQARIAAEYQDRLNNLARVHRFPADNEVTILLTLTATGQVSDHKVTLPDAARFAGFARDIAENVKGWTFPSIKQEGVCEVKLKFSHPIRPGGREHTEMMAVPMD